jgi:hypothetical protein
MLAASPVALAQNSSGSNPAPTTNPTLLKGQAEQKRQDAQKKMAGCINQAQQNKIDPKSDEFNRSITRCLNG